MIGYFAADSAQAAVRDLQADRGLSVSEVARYLNVDRRTVQRLFGKGRIRSDAADRIAVALGRHPCELWPDWFKAARSRPGTKSSAL